MRENKEIQRECQFEEDTGEFGKDQTLIEREAEASKDVLSIRTEQKNVENEIGHKVGRAE